MSEIAFWLLLSAMLIAATALLLWQWWTAALGCGCARCKRDRARRDDGWGMR